MRAERSCVIPSIRAEADTIRAEAVCWRSIAPVKWLETFTVCYPCLLPQAPTALRPRRLSRPAGNKEAIPRRSIPGVDIGIRNTPSHTSPSEQDLSCSHPGCAFHPASGTPHQAPSTSEPIHCRCSSTATTRSNGSTGPGASSPTSSGSA